MESLSVALTFMSSPWRWITFELPASSWRLSMFWVTTVTSKMFSSSAMWECAEFGEACRSWSRRSL